MTDASISPIAAAAYQRDWDEVRRLRAAAADLDLHDAAIVGDTDALAAALQAAPERVSEPAADGFRPLHLASYFARPEAVRILLDAGADPDAVADQPSRLRPLHAATAAGSTEVVALLLAAGADANVVQEGGYTPLMAAAIHDDQAMVALLLDHGADPSRTDDEGRTATDHADSDIAGLERT